MAVEADHGPPTVELALLESVGYLLAENEEGVLIGMEKAGDVVGRYRMNIPRGQIVSMKTVELEKAFNRKARTIV